MTTSSAISAAVARPQTTTPRAALIIVVVGDLGGSGGTERLFTGLHEYLCAHGGHTTLITASTSLARLQAAGRLRDRTAVVTLPLGPAPARGRLGVMRMTAALLGATLGRGFDIVHICLPTPVYVPFAAIVARLPRAIRPAVALTVVDCTLAHSLDHPPPAGSYERQVLDAHRLFARWVRLDGVYTWYRAFIGAAGRQLKGAHHGVIRAARYCFTEPDRFAPAAEKEPLVVFAGRLSDQKRPLLFVDAVRRLREREPALIAGWRFELYGRGLLEDAVRARIAGHGLGDIVRLTSAIDMAPVLARARVFVSTQAFENFTSLAMLEAMAAGNAIVAEDVGQTREFVHDGENGYLAAAGTADAFAAAMAECLRHPGRHEQMAAASRRLATEVHTVEHFAGDILAFWRDVLRRQEGGAAPVPVNPA